MYLQDEKQAQGGMSVTALTLSYFRSHRSARLTLREGPVVIIGPNGAGKTSLLEAVSLLSPAMRCSAPAG
jgi:DNA replication and repair protein RecF